MRHHSSSYYVMALYLFKFEFVVCWRGGPGWGLAPAPGHIFCCHMTIVIYWHACAGMRFGLDLNSVQRLYKRPATCTLTIGFWKRGLFLHLHAVIWVIRPRPWRLGARCARNRPTVCTVCAVAPGAEF
jgi:hypothetical protein